MTLPHLIVVPAETLADLEPAAVLLTRARIAVPDRRLLGSGTAMTTAPADLAAFVTVLAYALKAGDVDLAFDGARLVGVACWIMHLAQRHRPEERVPGPRRPSDQHSGGVLAGLRTRLDLLDGGLGVPHGRTHHHLAYLATRPGHGGHLITGLLLEHRVRAADEHDHALYLEVHDPGSRRRLSRCGYHDLGGSRGDPSAPRSWAMCRNPVAVPDTPAGGLGAPGANTGGGR